MPDSFLPQRDEIRRRLEGRYVGAVPHNKALNLRVTDYRPEHLCLALPYREDLVGNPETGVLHGGCITSLIDATCGGAVILSLVAPRRVATLDLRIDYVRPALPHQEVICDAHCYKVTRHVAFVRASAHHGDKTSPIATASGTFVVFRDDRRSNEGESE
ncbi:MAG: PaaI family thioesterase [Polyangiales bacterium]|jgi:uncharacterized protein (TIGR00369 family)